MKKLLLTDITADLVGARISGWLKQCEGGTVNPGWRVYKTLKQFDPCDNLFIGAKDALYCSDRCRKGVTRDD